VPTSARHQSVTPPRDPGLFAARRGYLGLLGANRPSHEGVIDYYDRAIALCRQAGFTEFRLRGDTDFSLTTELDRWDTDGVRDRKSVV
jgi:hypothetical protein